ncbi:transcription elongation factor S-II [Pyrenophora seminiperda CCB06]|uniref:Transcription elongation factor n=1 Tax=Pyrenophora seminiperda CCB06 TaxID=1302712 RepID=A0A3M7LWT2_9PLEO|nr:transcription elongation factor S-II [Pyrenophora seminiperda CCB06]
MAMDAKEIELRGKAIGKAVQEGEPSASILKLLNDLKTGVHATEDLLRSTRIGVTINRLRQHKDPAVQKLATELVSKWRDEVKKKQPPKKEGAVKASANGGVASSPAPPPSGTASPAPSQTKKKHDVPADKRNHKTDKVKYQVTGSEARDNCVRLMYDGLAFMSEAMPDEILVVAKQVEAAAYTNAGSVNDGYKNKIRSLFQNLKNKSNPALRKRVLTGDVPAKRFVVMTHDEMKSDERRAEDEKLEAENMNEAMVAQVEKAISKEFQCSKCKKKMVSYSQAQTRSADEPMTTFCECMYCGNRWKFS